MLSQRGVSSAVKGSLVALILGACGAESVRIEEAGDGGAGEQAATGGTATGGNGGRGGLNAGGASGTGVAGGGPNGGKGGSSAGKGGSSGGTGGAEGGGMAGEAGAGGSTGGQGGNGGDGGAGGMPNECTSHADCFELYSEDSDSNPRACVEGTCVPLRTADCPVVLPLSDNDTWDLLKSSDAIIVGAFAPLNNGIPDTITRVYDLAVSELSNQVHGVFAGSPNRHELVMVVCQDLFDSQDEVLAPAKHLVEELGVKGIVATLLSGDQQYVFEEVAQPNDVFMMVPLYSDQALIDLPDNGLVWHMLSGATQLSVSYQPLLDMTRTHLEHLGSLGSSEGMKLALVTATDQGFLQETSDYFVANVQYNGQSVTLNASDTSCALSNSDPTACFKPINVISAYADASDPQTGAIQALLDYAPHVIVGSTASEMLSKIIPGVEASWDSTTGGQDRPFYLLGALDFYDPTMASLLLDDTSVMAGQVALMSRILGVNWPAAEDTSVFDGYELRYQAQYGSKVGCCENYYDAAYYLMYAVAAAQQPLTGHGIASGMLRVTTGTTEVDVGPSSDMATAIDSLHSDASSKIKLIGAQGPPSGDEFGARNDPASVWCVNGAGSYKGDQLRYDPSTMLLEGTVSCFTFPEP
jgi:hypothetical protein